MLRRWVVGTRGCPRSIGETEHTPPAPLLSGGQEHINPLPQHTHTTEVPLGRSPEHQGGREALRRNRRLVPKSREEAAPVSQGAPGSGTILRPFPDVADPGLPSTRALQTNFPPRPHVTALGRR